MQRGIAYVFMVSVAFAPGLAREAAASVEIGLEWVATSSVNPISTGTLGTPDYVGLPGDVVTAELVVSLGPGDTLSVVATSLEWDLDLKDELDLILASEPPSIAFPNGALLTPITPEPSGSQESDATQPGFVQTFETGTLTPPFAEGSVMFSIGTLEFELTTNLETDGHDLFPLFDGLGVDGASDEFFMDIGPSVVFHPASVNLVPEPGGALLVGWALLGLASVRRRV